MDLAVWIGVYLVTWLNILNTVESLSECSSSLSSASHACAGHAATSLALQAAQALSPSVTSFPLVCLRPAQHCYTHVQSLANVV
jgi:hypothetical protein